MNVHAYRLLVSHQNVPEWQPQALRGLTKQRDLYTTFEGDQEGDDFEKFITREIEEPGQAAIEKLVAKAEDETRRLAFDRQVCRRPADADAAVFHRMGQETQRDIPETLQSILDKVERKRPAKLVAAEA